MKKIDKVIRQYIKRGVIEKIDLIEEIREGYYEYEESGDNKKIFEDILYYIEDMDDIERGLDIIRDINKKDKITWLYDYILGIENEIKELIIEELKRDENKEIRYKIIKKVCYPYIKDCLDRYSYEKDNGNSVIELISEIEDGRDIFLNKILRVFKSV